ncbi:MAG: ABC transporter permease [Candidatus Orphnella occulta]|nr:ABC transporter permease [Candidatus Orphnella occulta]
MIIKDRIVTAFRTRAILKEMVIRKFRAKYSKAMFGFWWAVVTPLILAFSIDIIFKHVFKVNIHNFTLFVLSGIIPWLFFSNTVMDVANSFAVDSAILKQGVFSRELIPISCVLANFLSFLIGIIFLLPLFLIANPHIIKALPFLILILSLHLGFIVGLGMIFATLNTFHDDLVHFLSVGLMLWFWVTPVFYSLQMLNFPYRWMCLLNPLTYYIVLYRQVLYDGRVPSLEFLSIAFLISIISFIGGYWFFIKREPELFKKL